MAEPIIIENPEFNFHFEFRNVAFANGIQHLYQGEKQCDVTFIVEGKKIMAHRHILAFISDAMAHLFETLPQYKGVEVLWEGGSYDSAKYIMQYIYHGLVKIRVSDLKGFVAAAQFFDVKTDLQDLNLASITNVSGEYVEIIYNCWGEEMANGFQKLYTEQKLFDVTILVDGKELKAHRHALSACSSYFEAMFSAADMERQIEVVFNDDDNVTYDSVQCVLQYIYLGEVKVNDLIPFLNTGEFLEIYGLKRADDLRAKRLSNKNVSSFDMYAGSKDIVRNEDKTNANVKTIKITQKASKPRRKVVESDEDSEQESEEYSAFESESDSDEFDLPQRKPTKPRVAPPNRMTRARMQKMMPNQCRNRKGVAVHIPSQQVNKVQGNQKQSAAVRQVKPRNSSKQHVGNTKLNFTQEEIDIIMSLRMKQARSHMKFEEKDASEEAVDEVNKPTYQQNDYVYDETEEASASNWKKPDEDQNNNNRRDNSTGDMSQGFNELYTDQYYCNSDDGAVGGYVYAREEGDYDKNMTEESWTYGSQTDEQSWANNDRTTAFEDDIKAPAKKSNDQTFKTKRSGKLGVGKNAVPLNDDDYNVEAIFTTTKKGAHALALGGNLYLVNRRKTGYNRYQCNFRLPGPEHKRCSAYAYTKEINGVTMACLSSPDRHSHAPRY